MFFMRVAMPLNSCGMRLHIDNHCNSRSSWVKVASVSCSMVTETALGIVFILAGFDCCWRRFFQEKPIPPSFTVGAAGELGELVGRVVLVELVLPD